MRTHPREKLIDEAEAHLEKALRHLRNMDLTDAEFISVVTQTMSRAVLSTTKYEIRIERHGDADQPGGLE